MNKSYTDLQNNKKIFWVSSYPKSGNTWMRLILCGLFFTEDGQIDNFEILKKIPAHDSLSNFEYLKDINNSDYNIIFNNSDYDESTILTYSKYWIEAQKKTKITNGSFGFFKTHNARVCINNNNYTNSSVTKGFVYIYRDPRDICISYSKHMNKDINHVVDFLLDGQIMEKEKVNNKMPEILLNWNDHYLSWKNFSNEVPGLFIRYEDFLEDFEKEINKIINFFINNFKIDIINKKVKIKNILKSTSFENLKDIENKYGFVERSDKVNFFRSGNKNQWVKSLSNELSYKIEKRFFKQMSIFKYL